MEAFIIFAVIVVGFVWYSQRQRIKKLKKSVKELKRDLRSVSGNQPCEPARPFVDRELLQSVARTAMGAARSYLGDDKPLQELIIENLGL